MGNQLQRVKDIVKAEEGLLGDRVHKRKGCGRGHGRRLRQ